MTKITNDAQLDELVEAVSKDVGYSPLAWDMVPPRTLVQAIADRLAPPAGFVMVPVVATDAMLDVMHEKICIRVIPHRREANIRNDQEVWAAMIAAAPGAADGVRGGGS